VRVGRFLGVLVCVGGTLLAAGCGTEHVQSGGGQPVSLAAAVSRTQEQTARIAISIGYQMQGMTISYTETGDYDFAHSRGTISMQAPVDMTEVFLPPTTYLKLPADAIGTGSGSGSSGSALPKGKSWVALSDSAAGSLLNSPEDGADPADLLAALTAASSSVRKLGPSVIRGVPVTGYALTVDSAKAATISGADRAAVEALLSSSGESKIPVDVWVDGQNLVRRESLTLAMPGVSGTGTGVSGTGSGGSGTAAGGSGAAADGKLTLTTDFYDFGVPVRISAPPAAEVIQESQAFKALGSSVSSGSASGSSATATPPPVSGTLTPDQATAAEAAVSAFWTALGAHNTTAVAATVLPGQRSCVQSALGNGAPTISVSSLHITSAEPAGASSATVRFTVKAEASLDGQAIPIFPEGPGSTQWLSAAEMNGHWYVDLDNSAALAFGDCS
jgi:hypothetical protein